MKTSIINYKQHFIKNQPIAKATYTQTRNTRETGKQSIADSQAIRVKRICSINLEFESHINTIKDQFVECGMKKLCLKIKSRKLKTEGFFL